MNTKKNVCRAANGIYYYIRLLFVCNQRPICTFATTSYCYAVYSVQTCVFFCTFYKRLSFDLYLFIFRSIRYDLDVAQARQNVKKY